MTPLFAESDLVPILGLVAGVLSLLISTGGGVLVAYLAFKTAQMNAELKANTAATQKNGEQIEVVHKATNSLAEEMGRAKLAQGTAEGTAAGLAAGRAEGPRVPAGVIPITVQAEKMDVTAESVSIQGGEAPAKKGGDAK